MEKEGEFIKTDNDYYYRLESPTFKITPCYFPLEILLNQNSFIITYQNQGSILFLSVLDLKPITELNQIDPVFLVKIKLI